MVAAPPGNPNKATAPSPPGGARVHGAASSSATRQSPVQNVQPSTSEARARSPPTTGQQLRTSASGRVRASNSTSSASNFPDVTADIYDAGVSQDSPDIPGPDYPLDSLPRHASVQSLGTQPAPRDVQGSSAGPRQTHSFSGASQVPEGRTVLDRGNLRVSDPLPVVPVTRYAPTSIGAAPIPAGPVIVTPPRSTGVMTSHVFSVPMTAPSSTSQGQVSHSNVVVSVNHSLMSASDPRQIQTQNLNVGVMSRLDPNRQPPNILPDLLAHSHPQPTPQRASQSQSRPAVPNTDPRVSQGHRSSGDHASRHARGHRDYRQSRTRRHSHRHSSSSEDEPCKESCYKCLAVGTSFRWILVVLSLLGVCCVVTGIVLAALHAAGKSFLFLAIMFIGLGVLLVVVVGVGWKCTPKGHEPLHALFHLGEFRTRRSGRRRRTHRHRDGRWYGGTMYPEFQYRRPPPSYNASMQQQAVAAQQMPQTPDLYDPNNLPDEDYSLPSSPPPSYRSRASTVRAGIQITFPPNQGGDYPDSRPPTYRSHQAGRSRPSLSRDDEDYDDDDVPAPADVAFTGSAVIVDTSTNHNGTSIQIDPSVVSNQNVTVSVTTVSVTTQPAQSDSPGQIPALEAQGASSEERMVDPVGTDFDGDKVQTQL